MSPMAPVERFYLYRMEFIQENKVELRQLFLKYITKVSPSAFCLQLATFKLWLSNPTASCKYDGYSCSGSTLNGPASKVQAYEDDPNNGQGGCTCQFVSTRKVKTTFRDGFTLRICHVQENCRVKSILG